LVVGSAGGGLLISTYIVAIMRLGRFELSMRTQSRLNSDL
jgi:hypothetical protein